MPQSFNSLEIEALKLPPEERVLLADHLLASVGGNPEIEAAWAAEVEQRLTEVEIGNIPLIPMEEAIRRARQSLS